MMRFKEVALSNASPEAKIAGLAVLLDKELLRLSEVVLNTKKLQGPQGEQGLQGLKGEQGDRGFDGANGKDGFNGKDGKDGEAGKQGVGVQDAKIDFDGSLVITLTDGTEINAGDVVPEGAADNIKVIKSGGGNSQTVLDAIEDIQATIATYGTIATQDADAVAITGGSINGTTIGATTAATGTFTTLIGGGGSANYGQLTGGATTKSVEFKSLGSDTNVALAIRTQGTGAIDLAAGSRGVNISNGGTVTAITRTNGGSTYTSTPTLTIAAPTTAGGVQATATFTMGLGVTPTVTAGGTGYTVGNTLTVVGGTGTAAVLTVSAVSAGAITAVTVSNFGTYSVLPSVPFSVTGGTGSSATFTSTFGVNSTFTITNAGSGYVEQPTVSFSGGGGSGAAAYATVGSSTTFKTIGTSLSFSGPAGEVLRLNGNAPSGTLTDYAQIDGGVSGVTNGVYLRANGSSTNQALYLQAKGTSAISFFTNWVTGAAQQLNVAHTASAVNYVQVTGAATGGRPTISAQGSDAAVGLNIVSKSSGVIAFYTNTNTLQAAINHVSSAANYLNMTGAAAGNAPSYGVAGSDTNIDLTLTPKGTGNVRFGTYTASMALTVQGYIEIKDSGGTVRKLAVIA